ncbi:MAG: orotidine-5'-phosphate decarboxylase [Pyrinomonas sp.]|uniref:orotidine-5'-phosphate decarboxylase n=1 Tax=Pyrinomonas sp. TaxID=2080306 RepID=UPI003331B27A
MAKSVAERLIIALDVESAAQALRLVEHLQPLVGMFKVGSQLFTAAGPEIVRRIVQAGARVFLDLKFHDIPNTVAGAAAAATRMGVHIFNVHALGGSEMMRRAAEAAHITSARQGTARPHVIAVTALTSADQQTLAEIGINQAPAALVLRLAKLAAQAGLDGVVASPQEAASIRASVQRDDFLVVTPGVRPAFTAAHDQKRVATPAAAILAGADYVVMGRAVLEAPDPPEAVKRIIEEIERALDAQRSH